MDLNAIARARLEAKRLFKRIQSPQFVVPTSLGATLDLVAAAKGFPHWHAVLASNPQAPCPIPSSSPMWNPQGLPSIWEQERKTSGGLDTPGVHGVCGRPGSGKSSWMTASWLSRCLETVNDLPPTHVVEIGGSGAGAIAALRAQCLPTQGEREIVHLQLQPKLNGQVLNPLDTPLGLSQPIGRDWLSKNLWFKSVLETAQAHEKHVSSGSMTQSTCSAKTVEVILREAYARRLQTPLPYKKNVEPSVDDYAQRHGLQASTWWGWVNTLMAHGEFVLARRAQRQAVPTLSEALSIAKQFIAIEENSLAFVLLVGRWQQGATNVDWEDARVVVLDLERVLTFGPSEAMMYLGAQVALQNQPGCVTSDESKELEQALRGQEGAASTSQALLAWHQGQSQRLETLWSGYDEFHRVSNSPLAQEWMALWSSLGSRTQVIATQGKLGELKSAVDTAPAASLWMLDWTPQCGQDWAARLGWSREQVHQYSQASFALDSAQPQWVRARKQGLRWETKIESRPTVSTWWQWALTGQSEDALLRERLVAHVGWAAAVTALNEHWKGSCKVEWVRRVGQGTSSSRVCGELLDEMVLALRGVAPQPSKTRLRRASPAVQEPFQEPFSVDSVDGSRQGPCVESTLFNEGAEGGHPPLVPGLNVFFVDDQKPDRSREQLMRTIQEANRAHEVQWVHCARKSAVPLAMGAKECSSIDTLLAQASAGTLIEFLGSLLPEEPLQEMWRGRALSLLSALVMASVYRRDQEGERLDADTLSKGVELGTLIECARREDWPAPIANALHAYLQSLPGELDLKAGTHSHSVLEQHGFLQQQLAPVWTLLEEGLAVEFTQKGRSVSPQKILKKHQIVLVQLPPEAHGANVLKALAKASLTHAVSRKEPAMGSVKRSQ